MTDAEKIEIAFGKTEYAKTTKERVHLFDLFVDGRLTASYETESDITFEAAGKAQRFTIYFPCYAFPIISSMHLVGATIFEPQKKEIDILFLGDSIT